jgi:hypothetical protein
MKSNRLSEDLLEYEAAGVPGFFSSRPTRHGDETDLPGQLRKQAVRSQLLSIAEEEAVFLGKSGEISTPSIGRPIPSSRKRRASSAAVGRAVHVVVKLVVVDQVVGGDAVEPAPSWPAAGTDGGPRPGVAHDEGGPEADIVGRPE